jgi:hypothetical protein
MRSSPSPGTLTRHWLALLLAPGAWVAALILMFYLTGDACAHGSRGSLWAVLAGCVVTAVVAGGLAWPDRRRFLTRVGLGLSAMFALVLLLMAVPVLMLGACRT